MDRLISGGGLKPGGGLKVGFYGIRCGSNQLYSLKATSEINQK